MASKITKYETEQEEPVNIFASKENHYPLDQLLRKHGFKIYSRKNNQEAVWTKGGAKFSFSHALKLVPYYEVEEAKRQ